MTLQAALFICTLTVSAEIIPSNRRYDWRPSITVGVLGGIPERTNIFCDVTQSIPGTNIVAVGNGLADDWAPLQAAINLCPSNQVVYVPPGKYRLTNYLSSGSTGRKSDFTLRGAGAGQTLLVGANRFTNAAEIAFGSGFFGPSISATRTADILSGGGFLSTNIVLASAPALLATNVMLYIDQLNDTNFVDSLGSSALVTFSDRPRDGTRNLQMFVRVVQAVGGTNITFWPPLTFAVNTNLSAQATVITETHERVGLENFTLTIDSTSTAVDAIRWYGGINCWMAGVEVTNVPSHAVSLAQHLHFEARSNYMHDIKGGAGTVGYGYGWDIRFAYGSLFEDNICARLYAPFLLSCGSAGNVAAYNFITDTRNSTVTYQIASMSSAHGAHPHMNLFEGNKAGRDQADFNWGSSSHFTVFRNHYTGTDDYVTNNRMAIVMDRKSVSNNIVGNILGSSNIVWAYGFTNNNYSSVSNVIYRLGYPYIGNNTYTTYGGVDADDYDTNVVFTIIRHGNYDYANADTVWDSGIADHTLQDSFYLTAAPAWWPAGKRFPLLGPDLSPMLVALPAEDRFNGVTVSSARTLRTPSAGVGTLRAP